MRFIVLFAFLILISILVLTGCASSSPENPEVVVPCTRLTCLNLFGYDTDGNLRDIKINNCGPPVAVNEVLVVNLEEAEEPDVRLHQQADQHVLVIPEPVRYTNPTNDPDEDLKRARRVFAKKGCNLLVLYETVEIQDKSLRNGAVTATGVYPRRSTRMMINWGTYESDHIGD